MTRVSRVQASNPGISTQQVTPGQVAPVSRVNAPETPALSHHCPQSGPSISSTTSNPISRATPVIRINTAAIHFSPVSQGQMSPVTRGNAQELAVFQTSQATAASLSSPSANTQPTSNNHNNSFKRLDCTPPTANSATPPTLSTLLTPGNGPQVDSFSRPFLQSRVLHAQASAPCHPTRHSPDHVVGASGISGSTASGIPITIGPSGFSIASTSGVPMTATTRPSSALLHPPRRLPDHAAFTSAVSVPRSSDLQAPITRGGQDASTAYNGGYLDIH